MSRAWGPDMKTAREELQRLQRTAQIVLAIHVLIYAAVLVLVLLLGMDVLGMTLGWINIALYFLVVRRQLRGYSDDVGQVNVLYGLCQPLQKAGNTGKKGMTCDEFRAMKLLPLQDDAKALLLRNGFRGESRCAEIAGHEITFHYPCPDEKGKKTYRFLSGTLLTAAPLTGRGPQEGDWLILRKGMLEETAQRDFLKACGYCRAECTEPGLEENYEVYAGEPGRTFAGKSAWGTSKLAGKSSDHLGAVRLTEKGAAVFLKDQFYTWKVKLRDLPEEGQLIRNPLPGRDEAFELLNTWCSGKM